MWINHVQVHKNNSYGQGKPTIYMYMKIIIKVKVNQLIHVYTNNN